MEDKTVTFRAATARPRFRLTTKPSLFLLLAGLVVLTGCGGSSSSYGSGAPATSSATTSTPAASTSAAGPSAGSGQTVSLAANTEGQLKYDTTSLSASAGQVSISFTNMSSLEHNVTVTSAAGAAVGATPTFQGGSKTLKLNLKPGTYKFFCSVPGHRAAGMEGTLTVK